MFRHWFGIGYEQYRTWEWERFELHKDYVRKVSALAANKTGGGDG